MIRVPPGSRASTAIWPSCDSINRLAVAMPSPVPRAFVVLNGRNSAARISAGMPGPESAISIVVPRPSARNDIRTVPRPCCACAALISRFCSAIVSRFGSASAGAARPGR